MGDTEHIFENYNLFWKHIFIFRREKEKQTPRLCNELTLSLGEFGNYLINLVQNCIPNIFFSYS